MDKGRSGLRGGEAAGERLIFVPKDAEHEVQRRQAGGFDFGLAGGRCFVRLTWRPAPRIACALAHFQTSLKIGDLERPRQAREHLAQHDHASIGGFHALLGRQERRRALVLGAGVADDGLKRGTPADQLLVDLAGGGAHFVEQALVIVEGGGEGGRVRVLTFRRSF